MSVREYIGARYVPVFANPIEWNSANTYEPLTIVLHEGNSYTSRQAVPTGIDITNATYWAQTGNYNAQIEQYRQDVAALANRFPVSILDGGTGGTDAVTARSNLDAAQANGATNTLYDAEQAIAANAADIISLQDSVSQFGIRSLLLKTNITTTTTPYTLYGERKFSDYDFIIIRLMDDASASPIRVRATAVLPASFDGFNYIYGIHGSTSGNLKDYQVTMLELTKQSDTTVNLSVAQSAILRGVTIEGIRVRA